jgi:pilus assembly protein FimV
MIKKLFFSLLMFPGLSLALGFGDITVFSKLNEPLKIHIALTDTASISLDDIRVNQANSSVYRKAALPRPEALNRVKIQVLRLANGKTVAVFTTKKPVREPFITFIAELKWPRGLIHREYTFLLDPPEFVQKFSQASQTSISSKPAAVKAPEKSQGKFRKKTSKKRNTVTRPVPVDSATLNSSRSDDTYLTRPGDTLWNIAKKVKPDNSVSTWQTMKALHLLNPNAFINGNIDRLKQGETLVLPTREGVLQLNGKKVSGAGRDQALSASAKASTLRKQTAPRQTFTTSKPEDKETQTTGKMKAASQSDEASLKIFPPNEQLLNQPVSKQQDLQLINKALKTSVETIKLLKEENDDLTAKIEELTRQLIRLENKNLNLDQKIDTLNEQIQQSETFTPIASIDTSSASSGNTTAPLTTVQESGQVTTGQKAVKATEEQAPSIEITSDSSLVEAQQTRRSFIRDLFSNPVITFVLVVFTIIILAGVFLMIRSQSEKRKSRQTNSYQPFPTNTTRQGPATLASRQPASPQKKHQPVPPGQNKSELTQRIEISVQEEQVQEKSEEDMDFFEYFEKKINTPDDITIKAAEPEIAQPETTKPAKQPWPVRTEPAEQTIKETDTQEEVDFSLDISDEDIADYEKSINQTYGANQASAARESVSEADTYLAYGNYEKAMTILVNFLNNYPEDINANLKLLDCYCLSNKRYEFIQHIKTIINLLNTDMAFRHRVEKMYQQTWDEPLQFNKFT